MLKDIEKLAAVAAKEERTIIGLMSGTSLDGLDIALCKVSGSGRDTKVTLEAFATAPYHDDYRSNIGAVFSKRDIDLELVCLLNPYVARIQARLINEQLHAWDIHRQDIDLIASHGQTIYHAPKSQHKRDAFSNATLQLGDGDHMALETGVITISDFRQKHIAAGGEGAPLAAYGDYLIFSTPAENRILLNIGGIANITFLPKSLEAREVFSTDIGPGNTVMDAYIREHFPGKLYDTDAELAGAGAVHERLLRELMSSEFFAVGFPKTTGPELFNLSYLKRAQQNTGTQALSHMDIMATLNRFSAEAIAQAIATCPASLTSATIFASGGGVHNPLLIATIQNLLPQTCIKSTAELFIDPDAKEAVLFAILANECVAGQGPGIGNPDAGIPSISMGKISLCH